MALSHNPRIVTDGLVLCLDAANPKSYPGSGTTWFDLSGNGNNGTLLNGVGYSSNNKGSMVFDGVDDTVSINKDVDPSPNPFTAFLWFKYTRTSGYSFSHLIDNLSYNSDIGWHSSIARYNTFQGQVSFRYVDYTRKPGSDGFNILSSHTNLDNGDWHLATYLWDGSTDTNSVKIYINGEISQIGTSSLSNTSRVKDIKLGKGNHGNGIPFMGYNSSFFIYDRILTASEIQQNFQALRGRYGI